MTLDSLGNPEEDVPVAFLPRLEADDLAVEGPHRLEVVDAKRDLSQVRDPRSQGQTVSISATGWIFTERSTPEPELTKACGISAAATTMSPAPASIVSSPMVNV